MRISVLLAVLILSVNFATNIKADDAKTDVWRYDFEKGLTGTWQLHGSWHVGLEGDDNHVFVGEGATRVTLAKPNLHKQCYNYILAMRIRLDQGTSWVKFRECNLGCYSLELQKRQIALHKDLKGEHFVLKLLKPGMRLKTWYDVKIVLQGQHINIFFDDRLKITYTDRFDPLPAGCFSLLLDEGSQAAFDDISLALQIPLQDSKWIRTGGPNGGLGYDIRIHPRNKMIMFVSDNPSGVNKSVDGGKTWTAKNNGIDMKTGPSGDGVPVFSLTIDPNNPDIVWVGTQGERGIYKSTDCGESWTKMDHGVEEQENITFRSFTVQPGNSDIVYAGAEISTGIQGIEFDKARGKIYKTEDGGRNWHSIWSGGSLVRFIIVDPRNTDVLYASTGIFDREAYNDTGVGVLKSEDGGKTWRQINNGIDNLFVGFLEMHPRNPDILFAAAGMNSYRGSPGGIYRTSDRGEHWEKVLTSRVMNVVTFSPSNPDIIYAGNAQSFYRSDDGGASSQTYQS